MIVNRDSWHYKLLAFTTVMRNYYKETHFINYRRDKPVESFVDIYEAGVIQKRWKAPTTFCTYFQKVVFIPLYCVAANLSILAVALYFATLDVWATMTVIGAGAAFFAGLFTIVAIITGGDVASKKIAKFLNDKSNDAESFIGNTYKGYKENICSIIEVKK